MIEIKNLSYKYPASDSMALSDISLEIPRGDFLGITGASGAGKTTLIYTLCGVIPHTTGGDFYGSVSVCGKDTIEHTIEDIALDMGVVMSDVESQFVASGVEDEILFGLENFGVPHSQIEERIEWALEMCAIESLRHRAIATLSGGQKQKVAISAILALKPKILVLDEPTSELDGGAAESLFKVLSELNAGGTTIIVAEQRRELLQKYCKRIITIKKGVV